MKRNKSKERIEQEKRENPARSDFKEYQFGRDDGRGKLESQRRNAAAKRMKKGRKWKPK